MSPVKQTKFFSLDYDQGTDFYLQQYFANVAAEKMAGEATPTYFLLPFVIERIKKFNPDMKLIFACATRLSALIQAGACVSTTERKTCHLKRRWKPMPGNAPITLYG